jgi:hypothetical protein
MRSRLLLTQPIHAYLGLISLPLALTLAMATCLGAQAHAQTSAAPPTAPAADPADPLVSVPPVGYESVFVNTPRGVEMATQPWRAANDEVGKFRRGHLDILKWEEQLAADEAAARKAPGTAMGSPPKSAQPQGNPPPAGATPATPQPGQAPHKH